jgi:hypothetical protein
MGLQKSNSCPSAETSAKRPLLLKMSVVFTVHTSVQFQLRQQEKCGHPSVDFHENHKFSAVLKADFS